MASIRSSWRRSPRPTAPALTVVASAGNQARDIDRHPAFPAALPAPSVLSVTTTQADGSYWRRATRSVDLAAPGRDILSTFVGSGWMRTSGTSMAAPFVAGALALLKAAAPHASAAQLRHALLAGAARDRDLRGVVGAGRLDLRGALRRAVPGLFAAAARRRGR